MRRVSNVAAPDIARGPRHGRDGAPAHCLEDVMRKCLVIGAAALALTTHGACAADMYVSPQPIPYGYRWMGPYVGANFGYQWGQLSYTRADPSGIAGGFQGGYNWQI